MTVRLGLLAAARICEGAVVQPATEVEGVEVVAVAARSRERADRAAADWGIPRAHGSYEDLLADDEVEAVYVATPASLHRPSAIAALHAGKHVLVEKPLAANADDAAVVEAAAADTALVAMEAFHSEHTDVPRLVREACADESLGRIHRIDAAFTLPRSLFPDDDIRWDLALGGGAMMDLGVYPASFVTWPTGAWPRVTSAVAVCEVPDVDAMLRAEVAWDDDVTGSVTASMNQEDGDGRVDLVVTGDRGVVAVTNPLAPQHGGELTVTTPRGTTTSPLPTRSTYVAQLEAFRDAIVDGAPVVTTITRGRERMAFVDACYRAAGLPVRPAATNA